MLIVLERRLREIQERGAVVLQRIGCQRLKRVAQPLLGVVEQRLGGVERLRLAFGVLANPLEILLRGGEFGDRCRSRLGDLSRGDAAHHQDDDERSDRGDDECSQKIDSQFSLNS